MNFQEPNVLIVGFSTTWRPSSVGCEVAGFGLMKSVSDVLTQNHKKALGGYPIDPSVDDIGFL